MTPLPGLGAFAGAAIALFAAGAAQAGVSALEAAIRSEDADRFAVVFEASRGAPTANELQRGYLDPATRGVEIFTPGRIRDAAHLAETIAAHPEEYRRGVDVCLPIAKQASGELRAVYLAMEGLLDDPVLPEIYVVFGAGNSGGTTGPGAQVIGLEVLCRMADSEADIRTVLRGYFAHETVHTMQADPLDSAVETDLLLTWALREGVADFIAGLVTGTIPDPARNEWALAHEADVWSEFVNDRRATAALKGDARTAPDAPVYRWVANAGAAPEGWPSELGYWVGMRICQAYMDAAEDKRAAVKELLEHRDPTAILEKSGYAARFASAE